MWILFLELSGKGLFQVLAQDREAPCTIDRSGSPARDVAMGVKRWCFQLKGLRTPGEGDYYSGGNRLRPRMCRTCPRPTFRSSV